MPADAPLGPVLVADDEVQLLKLCVRVLERTGREVLTATTGDEALRVFRARQGDIGAVVLDATLPPDGVGFVLETILKLRADVGVVLTGGDSLDLPLRDLLLAHEGIFLHKPFAPRALLRAIEDSLIKEAR